MPRLTPPRGTSKVTFVAIGTTRGPAEEAGVVSAAARARSRLLGRLGVGAKLMLLVLLPVGVLLGFTIAESADNWRTALSIRDFSERHGAVVRRHRHRRRARRRAHGRRTCELLRPGDASLQRLRAAQAGVDAALKEGTGRAGAVGGTVDLGGRLDAVRRQLNALRVELASNSLTVSRECRRVRLDHSRPAPDGTAAGRGRAHATVGAGLPGLRGDRRGDRGRRKRAGRRRGTVRIGSRRCARGLQRHAVERP